VVVEVMDFAQGVESVAVVLKVKVVDPVLVVQVVEVVDPVLVVQVVEVVDPVPVVQVVAGPLASAPQVQRSRISRPCVPAQAIYSKPPLSVPFHPSLLLPPPGCPLTTAAVPLQQFPLTLVVPWCQLAVRLSAAG
jgi:hypothetical protein